MALVAMRAECPPRALWMGSPTSAPLLTNTTAISADAHTVTMAGRMHWADGLTHSIRNARVRFGTVIKAGGTNLLFGLQDVDLATGNPMRGDGANDQSVQLANADIPASNTPVTTGNFSADRSVAENALVALVISVDGGTIGVGDSFPLSFLAAAHQPYQACVLHGTTLQNNSVPMVEFIASDGTIGIFSQGVPIFTAIGTTVGLQSDTTPDEAGNYIVAPFTGTVGALFGLLAQAAAGDTDLLIYNGASVVATISQDDDAIVPAAGTHRTGDWRCTPFSVTAGDVLRVVAKPSQATADATLVRCSIETAARWTLLDEMTSTVCQYTSQTDAGGWTEVTTQRAIIGLVYTHIETGAAAAGYGGGVGTRRGLAA